MAYQGDPNDLKIYNPLSDEYGHQARLDNQLRPDQEVAEAPASGGRIAIFAVAIALVLGAAFYGLNNSTINHAGTSSTAQNTAPAIPPVAPPGMRDVTPRATAPANTEPGVTTGAAPAAPQTSIRSGAEVNPADNPPPAEGSPTK